MTAEIKIPAATPHLCSVVTGFVMLEAQGKIRLSISGSELPSDGILEVRLGGKTLAYDMSDGYNFKRPEAVSDYLKDCDCYFKRSFSDSLNEKFFPDSKEKIQKIENSKLFTHPKQIEYIMLILFLLPGTPKDLLTYLAGLLPIKPSRFIVIATLARLPSIISSTYAGATLINGNWKIGLLMYVGIFVVVGIAILLAKKFDKTEITKEILEETKKVN